jgi:hypothetical protein
MDITFITDGRQINWKKQYETWIKNPKSSICVVNIHVWFSAKIFIKTPNMIQYQNGENLDATLLTNPYEGYDRCIHSSTHARNNPVEKYRSGDWNKPIEIDIQANIAGPRIDDKIMKEGHDMHTQAVGNSSSADNLAIDCKKEILCMKRVLSVIFPSLTMVVYMTLFKMFFFYGNASSTNQNEHKRIFNKERIERLQKRGFLMLSSPLRWWILARLYQTRPQPTYQTNMYALDSKHMHAIYSKYHNIYKGFFTNPNQIMPFISKNFNNFSTPPHLLSIYNNTQDIFESIKQYYNNLIIRNNFNIQGFQERLRVTFTNELIQYGGNSSKINLANEYIVDPFTKEYIYLFNKQGRSILKEYILHYKHNIINKF